MTEAEWTTCRNPDEMLDYHKMKKAPRRLRLLAAACVRRVVTGLPEAGELVDVVERYADGTATRAEFLAVRKQSRRAGKDGSSEWKLIERLTDDAMEGMTAAIAWARHPGGREAKEAECTLIRDLFRGLYYAMAFDPSWRIPTVVDLARTMYESGDFAGMPVLADAIQEAGCEDEAVLRHCRAGGLHARGCWVVDAILGRE